MGGPLPPGTAEGAAALAAEALRIAREPGGPLGAPSRAASSPQGHSPHRVVVGIAGVPGSGKTTLAGAARDAVNAAHPGAAEAVSMDGFHLSRAELDRMPDPARAHECRGAHWTFDAPAFARAMERLRWHPGEVRLPSFDHAKGDPVPDDIVVSSSHRIVFAEGLYVLLAGEPDWRKGCEQCALRVFVDTPQHVATERLIRRHMAAWGITREKAAQRACGSDLQNAQLVRTTRPRAHLAVFPDGRVSRVSPPPHRL
eukprot:TRINITY_DN66531_c0_g1_i1.p1 TRINITY_DN66531_c0_g1~~TRINITY_DN66531_c0_g1_i1.p1  ORF type:complete len:279 (+),score=91.39 TRINITY_DN66531_c0_g1_i1:72-839(+)